MIGSTNYVMVSAKGFWWGELLILKSEFDLKEHGGEDSEGAHTNSATLCTQEQDLLKPL